MSAWTTPISGSAERPDKPAHGDDTHPGAHGATRWGTLALSLGRIVVDPLRLGFVALTARYGYQDEPDVAAALALARQRGLDIDLDEASYYVAHVTVLVNGSGRMARWRKHLFTALHRNATPVARSYNIPPERVVEVGGYVEV